VAQSTGTPELLDVLFPENLANKPPTLPNPKGTIEGYDPCGILSPVLQGGQAKHKLVGNVILPADT